MCHISDFTKKIITGTGGFQTWENRECVVHHQDRDISIADWVIRCLANPNNKEAEEVLQSIIQQRQKQS